MVKFNEEKIRMKERNIDFGGFFFTQVQLDFGGFDRMKLMNNYNVCKTWLKNN